MRVAWWYCQTFSSPRSAWLPVGAGEVLWWAGVLDNPGRFLLTAVEGAVAGSVLLLPPVNAVEGILQPRGPTPPLDYNGIRIRSQLLKKC